MNYTSFIYGPQYIGLLFIILGAIQRYFPPKNINRWYGYRTLTARTNQQTWDEGNRYSAGYMIKAGFLVLIIGFIINAISVLFITDFQTQAVISYIVLFGGAMGVGILSTVATEKHLKNTFKNLKKRK
jgi:uncharacterized membrane protein